MSEHVKACKNCRELRECKTAEAIIAAYPVEMLADALLDGQKPEHNAEAYRAYQREYQREWKRKKRGVEP